MKWRILASTLILPLIMALAFVYEIYRQADPYGIYSVSVILIISIARIFLWERRYLVNLNMTADVLEIKYYGPFLQLKDIHIPVSEVTNVQLSEVHWIPRTAGALAITTEKDSWRFVVLKREQFHQLQMKLHSNGQALG